VRISRSARLLSQEAGKSCMKASNWRLMKKM
jgi:hypothetical protein